MDKKLCEFLRYNVVEDKNGNRYQVQVCHQGGLDKVPAVRTEDVSEYDRLLSAKQKKELTSEQAARMSGLEVLLPIEDIEVADFVRFVNKKYDIKFIVKNFDFVSVNGEKRIAVAYGDNYHFAFYRVNDDGSFSYRGTYHIHEFAELTDINGLVVEPLGKTYTEQEVKKMGGGTL